MPHLAAHELAALLHAARVWIAADIRAGAIPGTHAVEEHDGIVSIRDTEGDRILWVVNPAR